MNEVYKLYLQQLESTAHAITPLGFLDLFVPTLILLVVFAISFFCIWLGASIRRFSMMNIGLLVVSLSWFQSCLGPATEPTRADRDDAAAQTVPPAFEEIENYFRPRVTVMKSRAHKDATSNPQSLPTGPSPAVPECMQYNLAIGKNANTSEYSCNFITHWSGPNGIREKLETCKPANGRYLVLDQVFDFKSSRLYQNDLESPLIRVESGSPFIVFTYCVDVPNKTVSVLNPQHISLHVRSSSENQYSIVEPMPEYAGWFKGGFLELENNKLSSAYSVIEMDRYQGDLNLSLSQGRIPKLRVQVDPESWSPWDPQFNMGRFVTDNMQSLVRDAVFHGAVNVSNGELAIQHTDVSIPLSDHDAQLMPARTLRSTTSSVGPFGYFWNVWPRLKYFSFASPIGEEGAYPFLDSGDGRLLYVPQANNLGLFWGVDPSDVNRANPLKPKLEETRYLHQLSETASFDLNGRLIALRQPTNENHVFYLRDGTNVILAMDTIAARSSSQSQQRIISAFKAAEERLRANQFAEASKALNDESTGAIQVQGNMLYFVYNSRGYVIWIVDKAGNATEFKYRSDQPDLLESVVRHVMHDPKGLGTAEYESIELYRYKYSRPISGIDRLSWPALLEEVSTYEREKELSKVTYTLPESRFGEAPAVSEYSTPIGSYEFKYSIQPLSSSDPSLTTVTDPMGRKYFYSYDWRGFVSKIEGPTAESTRVILTERLLDPHSLRVINITTPSGELIMPYDQSGQPQFSEMCGDRSDQQQVLARIGKLNADGEPIDIQCEGVSRKTPFQVDNRSAFYQAPWYADLAGSVTPLSLTLPQSSLHPDPIEITTGLDECFGGPGSITRNASETNGLLCRRQAAVQGGSWLAPGRTSSYENGGYKTNFNGSFPAGADDVETTLSLNRVMVQGLASQVGRYTVQPALGFDEVRVGEGDRFLTSSITMRRFDSYGNTIASMLMSNIGGGLADPVSWLGFGGSEYTYYNYLLPIAAPSAQLMVTAALDDEDDSIPASTLNEYETFHRLKASITTRGEDFPGPRQYVPDLDQRQFSWNFLMGWKAESPKNPLRPDWIFQGNDLKIFAYKENSPLLEQVTQRVESSTANEGQTLDLVTRFEYDRFERLTKTLRPDGTFTQIFYRSDQDRGVLAVREDRTALNDISTIIEIEQRDWADRPLVVRLQRLIPNDSTGDPVSSAPAEEEVRWTYSPFGEISSETTIIDRDNTITTTYDRDLASGVVTKVTKSFTGERMPPEEQITEFSEFTRNLRPLKVRDPKRNINTFFCETNQGQSCTSVGQTQGKDEAVEVWGPENYRGPTANVLYSKNRSFYDGCGNLIKERSYVDANSYLESSSVIKYGNGLCLPDYSVDESGWRTYYGYDSFGRLIFVDPTIEYGQPNRVDPALTILGERSMTFSFNSLFVRPDQRRGEDERPMIFDVTEPSSLKPLSSRSIQGEGHCGYSMSGPVNCAQRFIVDSTHVSNFNSLGSVIQDNSWFMGGLKVLQSPLQAWNQMVRTSSSFENSSQEMVSSGAQSTMKQLQSGALQAFSHQSEDPVFGIARRLEQRRVDPSTNQPKATLQQSVLDEMGYIESTKIYEANLAMSSNLGNWQPSNSHLKSQVMMQGWNANRPQIIEAQNWTPAGIVTDRIHHTEFGPDGKFELPTQTEISRVSNNTMLGTGLVSNEFDGAQRLKGSRYTQRSSAAAFNVDLTTTNTPEYDMLGRITSQLIKITDEFSSAVSPPQRFYQLGNRQVERDQPADPTKDTFNVRFAYPAADQMKMIFDGFDVTYTVSLATGQIMKVVIDPPGPSEPNITYYTHSIGESFTPPGLSGWPEIGNVDSVQGSIKLPDGTPITATTLELYRRGRGTYELNNQSNVPYMLQSGLFDSYTPDLQFRRLLFNLDERGQLERFWLLDTDENRWFSRFRYFGDPDSSTSSTSLVMKSRSMRQQENSGFTCDNVTLRQSSNVSAATSSFFETQGNTFRGGEPDRLTVFNEQGKLARQRYAYYVPGEAGPQTRKWFFESSYAYDGQGMPARVEEVFWAQNSVGSSPERAQSPYLWAEPKPMRVVIRNLFNVSLPMAEAFGGQHTFPLKEFIIDPGHVRHHLQNNALNQIQGCDLSSEDLRCDPSEALCDCRLAANPASGGAVYHIPGPDGVLMSLRWATNSQGVRALQALNYVRDQMGNIVSSYYLNNSNQQQFPDERGLREVYLPYLSSIVMGYNPVAARTLNDQPGHVVSGLNQINNMSNYRYSMDPEVFPRRSSFGPAGQRRDIAGIVQLGGKAYSTVEGRFLEDGFVGEDDVCNSGSQALLRAYAEFSASRLRDFNAQELWSTDSIAKRVTEADEYLKWSEGTFWGGQLSYWRPKSSAERFFESRRTYHLLENDFHGIEDHPAENLVSILTLGLHTSFLDSYYDGPGRLAIGVLGLIPVHGIALNGLVIGADVGVGFIPGGD